MIDNLPSNWARALILALCTVFASSPCIASSEDAKFIEGLRQRRVYSLAESYCRGRLADDQLEDRLRSQLTIELIRVASSQAINSPPADRPTIWKKAHDAADEFIIRGRENPRHILVRVQKALTHLAHGQLVRQELEAGAAGSGATETALSELRAAARLLGDIDKELTKEIPLRRRTTDDQQLTAEELRSLQNNVQYQLARALRNRALCYPAESVDRIDSLTRVSEQHVELLRRLSDEDPLRWKVRIESVVCQRQLGRFEGARKTLTALVAAVPPIDIQLLARAEAARLELSQDRPKVALSVLAQGRQIGGQASPELDFAHLETYDVFARATADDEVESGDWQKKSVAMARLIEHTHGPYWARRANLLLIRSAGSGSGSHDLEILVRVADDFYVKKQHDEAIQAYDKAAQQAQRIRNAEQAFTLYYKAALVEHARRRHAQASDRLRDLALEMKAHPKASDTHLLAAWNTSQLVAKVPASLADYTDLLEEHITTWPGRPSANKARMWLARLREHQRTWTEAIDLYLEVTPDFEQYASAIESAARCSQKHFAELKASGEDTAAQARITAARFEDLIFDDEGKLPATWTDTQRTAALSAGKIRLQFATDDHAAAGKILGAALKSSSDTPKSWQTSVRALLVVALAGQPTRRREAANQLTALAGSSPQQLIEILDGLAAIAKTARTETTAAIARLQLDAISTIAKDGVKLDETRQLHLDRIKAGALAASGQNTDALTLYEELAKQNPRNGQIQEAYAQQLLASTDKRHWEKAINQWRIVDRGSRQHTPRWYQAKYSIALAYFKLGDKKRAAQLIQYLKITPPGLEKTNLKREFELLLQRSRS